jgi:hypothetical protein
MRVSGLRPVAGLLCGLALGPNPGHAAQPEMRRAPDTGRPPVVLPSGPPPVAKGAPARPLTDAEFYRLLLVLSAQTKPPMDALAACYPFGRPGWRDCVTRR